MARKKIYKYQFGGGADAGGKKSPGKGTYQSPSASPIATANRIVSSNNSGSVGNIGKTVKRTALQAIPFTPAGMAVSAMKAIENARRAKRAKGEFFLSKKKELPITREFYRTEGRPLDTKIGGQDENYLKAAGVTGFEKVLMGDNAGPKTCPVGYILKNGVCVKIAGASKGGFTSKYYKGLL